MSEYWKSTPKYWCKHCKTYVRDTKLERQNHDATPKHQGNLKRFLRDLHRGHEKDEREKQRAKDEVARLSGAAPSGGQRLPAQMSRSSSLNNPQASPAERRRQMEQLAEMGVSIPEEFRKGMVMAGDWQVVAETSIYDHPLKEEEAVKKEEAEDQKSMAMNTGVRKRPHDAEEDEESASKRWRPPTQAYPTDDDADLDVLLATTTAKRKSSAMPLKESDDPDRRPKVESPPYIKKEHSIEEGLTNEPPLSTIKQENEVGAGIVFKKRKAKSARTVE